MAVAVRWVVRLASVRERRSETTKPTLPPAAPKRASAVAILLCANGCSISFLSKRNVVIPPRTHHSSSPGGGKTTRTTQQRPPVMIELLFVVMVVVPGWLLFLTGGAATYEKK